jgi:tRNA (mo5U34)-methyltransferase
MSAVDEIRALRPIDLYAGHKSGITEKEFRDRCGSSPIWHSVDLGDIFIEGQRKTGEVLAREMRLADLPDLRGKSVLDIGAFGGWFSFEAERRGAAHVTALEYHSWAVDWPKLRRYMRDERAAGRVPDPYHPPPHVVDEIGQPGRSVFDATRDALGSRVEPVLSRVEDYNPRHQFDVVLFLGVLYHCEDPLGTLRKVASLTSERLIIETEAHYQPGTEDKALWEFIGDDSVNNDITTWWAPNEQGLSDMLRAVGFRHIEIKAGNDQIPASARTAPRRIRIWAHAER